MISYFVVTHAENVAKPRFHMEKLTEEFNDRRVALLALFTILVKSNLANKASGVNIITKGIW